MLVELFRIWDLSSNDAGKIFELSLIAIYKRRVYKAIKPLLVARLLRRFIHLFELEAHLHSFQLSNTRGAINL